MSATAAAGDVLELDDVHLYYGAIHALKGVSLRVGAGRDRDADRRERRGQVDHAAGDQRAQPPARRAAIRFEGRDITMAPPHEIVGGGIAQSPEGRRLFPRMTVTENLEMGAFQRTDKENFQGDMDRVFELFPRLYERRTQKAGTMSGGEQQMCAIGRALMARPKLLLLDEPSMGLAPIFVEKIFEIVVEINAQGTPVLLVEQNALMALDTAHRGYVMETGRITLEGPAAELKTNEAVQKAYLGARAGSTLGGVRAVASASTDHERGGYGGAERGYARMRPCAPGRRGPRPSRARWPCCATGRGRAPAPRPRRGSPRR